MTLARRQNGDKITNQSAPFQQVGCATLGCDLELELEIDRLRFYWFSFGYDHEIPIYQPRPFKV